MKQEWPTTNNWNLLHFHQHKERHISTLCVNLEIIKAAKLDIDCGFDPCDWGWQRCGDVLKPDKMDLPPAPDFLLHVIHCNCKTISKNTCGLMLCTCRKNGDCHGINCENIEEERIGKLNNINDDWNIFEKLFELWWHFYF